MQAIYNSLEYQTNCLKYLPLKFAQNLNHISKKEMVGLLIKSKKHLAEQLEIFSKSLRILNHYPLY
jgi:hypothetical protein